MSDENPGNPSDPTPPTGDQPPPYPSQGGQQPNWGNAYPPPVPPGAGQPQYAPIQPKHPQATTAMVLGILGLVVCGVLAPFAWVIGGKAVKEIDANPGAYGGRSEANAGKIMGIIGSCLVIVALLFVVVLVIVGIAASTSSSSDYYIGGLF